LDFQEAARSVVLAEEFRPRVVEEERLEFVDAVAQR
jgi:hypothetical protein